jgi:hypothetical protein
VRQGGLRHQVRGPQVDRELRLEVAHRQFVHPGPARVPADGVDEGAQRRARFAGRDGHGSRHRRRVGGVHAGYRLGPVDAGSAADRGDHPPPVGPEGIDDRPSQTATAARDQHTSICHVGHRIR